VSSETTARTNARRILIGVTGGIAAYKTASLVSALVQRGDDVVVAMTESATRFVGSTTFSSLTGHDVLMNMWEAHEGRTSPHVHFATWADAMLIAPCTMDMLGKLVTGRTDDAVSLLAAAIDRRTTPVLLAPSMNAVMLSQPATVRNLAQLREDEFTVLEPSAGWQACRTEGEGRMPEPDELQAALAHV
jgi:phosphopantothenoylcysteine synthetase/decarboxylase